MLGIFSRGPKALKKLKLVNFQQSAPQNHGTDSVGSFNKTENAFKIAQPPLISKVVTDVNQEVPRKSAENGPRVNPFGIQMLPDGLFHQLFGNQINSICERDVLSAISNLRKYGLKCDAAGTAQDVDLKLPPLEGSNVEEHFMTIGRQQSEPYKVLIEKLVSPLPEIPLVWELQSGWTKYSPGKPPERVAYPEEDAIVIDVEVCQNAGAMPTLATAASPHSWYGWVSTGLVEGEVPLLFNQYTTQHLIPLESSASQRGSKLTPYNNAPHVAVGHNVMFDRSRFKEQYWLNRTGYRFVDTMSLHICVSGVTSYQKALLLKAKKTAVARKEEESRSNSDDQSLLLEHSSLNSLAEVLQLYCGQTLDKSGRDIFIDGTLEDVRQNFQSSMSYCAMDVAATHNILSALFPLFLERFPHPVTLAGMLEISLAYLPVNSNWDRYIKSSEQTYQDLGVEARFLLARQADEACGLLHNDQYRKDLWMWDQDWSVQELKLTKRKLNAKKGKKIEKEKETDTHTEQLMEEPHIILEETVKQSKEFQTETEHNPEIESVMSTGHQLPLRPPHLPGYPVWYRKLCIPPKSEDWSPGPQLASTKMQVTPKLLHLTWEKYPLHYVRGEGWGTLRPTSPSALDLSGAREETEFPIEEFVQYCNSIPKADRKYGGVVQICEGVMFSRLPHKNGSDLRVGDPLGRDFITKFSENVLSGDAVAEQLMDIARKLAYWRNNRDRIMGQLVVRQPQCSDGTPIGAILPQLVVCGTLTRRATERTWLTASNISKDRVGSELRAMVQAPPGYCLVGADVDSQELWIASLIGDANAMKMHGGTPFGWMTISGRKSDGSDMHSVTAKAVGISRDHAKVINYARIYGAGVPFAEQLLRQFNPSMSVQDAQSKAKKMFNITKGGRCYVPRKKYLDLVTQGSYSAYQATQVARQFGMAKENMFKLAWSGGTESSMFNRLEEIAHLSQPQTPFLGGKLSRALEKQKENYLPTRINWVVQSGAVDFLHLLLVAFRWLAPDARFCLSFHDEVRYLVPEERAYHTALALHAAHLLTRAFCVSRLGLVDLPLSVAFFNSVEVDRTLRKEAHDNCTTPSNPHGLQKGYGIPLGECVDIYKAIEKAGGPTVLLSKQRKNVSGNKTQACDA